MVKVNNIRSSTQDFYLLLFKPITRMATQEILNELESRAKKINQRVQRLEQENTELRASVFTYLQQIEQHQKEILRLQTEQKNKQITHLSNLDKKELQREIDKYVLMIEKCMASIKVSAIS